MGWPEDGCGSRTDGLCFSVSVERHTREMGGASHVWAGHSIPNR